MNRPEQNPFTKFKVWWMPQIPMKAFEIEVPTLEEGKRLCDTLAKYDAFQFENRIKPDYANVGGVSVFYEPEQEWWAVDESIEEEIAEYAV